jgi:nitroreductase
MEFTNVIQTRNSIRSYLDKEVEDEKIEYILECARVAPSWVNKQCWRFIVVKNNDTISELAKTSIINRWLKRVPCIIVACGDPTESGKKNDIEYYAVDVSIAMEHIVLAAFNVNLGSCWIGGFDEKKVKDILQIPNRIKVVAMTPIGYPSKNPGLIDNVSKLITRNTKRKNLNEIVHFEKW